MEWFGRAGASKVDRVATKLGLLRRYPSELSVTPAISEYRSLPDSIPAFWQLFHDDAGFLWVQEYPRGAGGRPKTFIYSDGVRASPTRFLVFAHDGSLAGRVELPARHTLLRIENGKALIRAIDDFDVESILIYEVIRGPT